MDGAGASLRLARQAAGLSLADMARLTHFDKAHLSNVERGKRGASPELVAAYERELARVDRRDFLAGVGSLAMPIPARVGPGDVRALQDRVLAIEQWDRATGGGTTAHLALAELQYAARLKSSSSGPAARSALNATVANLADTAAWASFDAGDKDTARRVFASGVTAARESGDAGMVAHVASGLARLEIEAKRPKEALAQLPKSQEPLTGSMLAVVRAQAYGALGERRECLAEVSLAERLHPGPAAVEAAPAWFQYFTTDKLTADVGLALWRLGDAEALPRLESSARSLPDSRGRAKALASGQLATALYRQRRPEEGWFWLTRARTVGASVRSARLLSTLQEAESAAKGYGMTTVTAEGRVWQAGALWVAEVSTPGGWQVVGTREHETKESAEGALRAELAERFPDAKPTVTVYE